MAVLLVKQQFLLIASLLPGVVTNIYLGDYPYIPSFWFWGMQGEFFFLQIIWWYAISMHSHHQSPWFAVEKVQKLFQDDGQKLCAHSNALVKFTKELQNILLQFAVLTCSGFMLHYSCLLLLSVLLLFFAVFIAKCCSAHCHYCNQITIKRSWFIM